MKAAFLAASAAMLMAGSAQAAVVIGGFTITSSATSLIESSGDYFTQGGPLATVVTDSDAATYAFSRTAGAFVRLGFASGILNAAGNDFVLFELGTPDSFNVTINGVTVLRQSSATGSTVAGFVGSTAVNFPLLAAAFDLSEFGVGAGSSVSAIRIGLDVPVSNGSTVPSLSFAGVLNSGTGTVVPEPSTWMLMIMGFGLIAQQLRRRHRGVAQVAA